MKTCPNCGSERTHKVKNATALFGSASNSRKSGWVRKCKDCGASFDKNNNVMLSDSIICPLCGGQKLKYNRHKELVCQTCNYNYEPEAMKENLNILRDLTFATANVETK